MAKNGLLLIDPKCYVMLSSEYTLYLGCYKNSATRRSSSSSSSNSGSSGSSNSCSSTGSNDSHSHGRSIAVAVAATVLR